MSRLINMIVRNKPGKTEDKKLDEALEQTFPASDPLAMTDPYVRVGRRRRAHFARAVLSPADREES